MSRRSLCLLLTAAACLFLSACSTSDAPAPQAVQVGNPMVEVSSREEMETMLDFSVPLLDKDVAAHIVLVIDGYPRMGRVNYADGGVFSIQYGSGDVSGIYGGTTEGTATFGGTTVTFLSYEQIRYATWEKDGFSCSLTGSDALEEEVAALLGAAE